MAYTNVSDEFKEIVKSNSITASAKIVIPSLNITILPYATDDIKSSLAELTIEDKCCDNGKYIGNAVSKKVELSIINKDNLDLADREFELYVGVKLSSGEYEYIPYGNFIVTTYEDTKSNNKFKIEAYDYMTKLNGYFNDILYDEKNNPNGLKIEYPIKLKAYKEKILTYMGISYVEQTLPNDNFSIDTAINFDGYTIRNVIAKIAELQGTFARINRENKMEFCLQTQTDEEIPLSSMNNKQEINNRYGPVNVVSLTMKNVKGENVTLRDDKSIDKYGENTIEIQDNPFVYTEALRKSAINELYNALKGFSYYPINFNWKARLYTDPSDIIKVYDMRNKKWVNSIVMNQTIKIPITRQSTLESPALTKTQVANQYISQSKQANTRTEIIVDKQNQKIESVVSNVTKQNNKISQITQTVDEINSKIQDIADITTYGESDRAEVELTDVNESEPIMIKVHPTSTNISYLYPSDNLYPSDTQYIPNRIIRFTRTYEEDGTTKTENIDYLLPDDLLRYSDTVYDEFYLNYESQTCQVIKRCAYNADGTVRALGKEITTDYPYPTITLGEGNYTITLPGYDFGYLYVRLMAKNIYTTQFYTKVETDSRINQKADSITSTVSQTYSTKTETNTAKNQAINSANSSTDAKLQNYSTTAQMNSAIEQKANQIAIAVSETYSKKTDAISEVNVEYALGTSTSTAPISGWSTTAPTWQQGKYMWQRTIITYANGTTDISNPTCIAGAKGQDGTNGTNGVSVSSITEYYAVSSSNSSAPADSAFKTTMQTMTATNKYLWNYEVITYSNNNTQKTIKRVIGTYGDKGTDGTNGIGIKSVTNKYQVSTSNTTAPTTWKDTPQTMTPTNKYLWNYEIITYSDNTTSTSTPAVIGAYGDKGNAGTNGVSVSSITEYYAVSSSNSTAPADSAFKTTMQTMTTTNKYLWNYEVITFSNSTTQNTNKRVIGVYGDKGQAGTNGTNGIGIKSVTNKYQVSTSNTTAPTSWKDTPQTMTATNKYLWNYEIITYSDNTTSTSTPAVIGTYGDKGNTGDTGKGVKAVVAQYYLSSSKTSQTGGSWAETQPAYKKDYYYWTRTKITWTDNTTTYTTPILVEEINSLNESVASLNIRAGDIESTVRKKVGNDEIISKINQSSEAVTIDANKINLNGKTINISANGVLGISSENFSVDTNGNVMANSGKMGGWTLSSTGLINEDGNLYIRNNGYSSIYTYADMVILRNYLEGKITLDDTDLKHYDVNHDGDINAGDLLELRRRILGLI